MKFRYQAKTKEGQMQVGMVEASTRQNAITILTNHELFILKMEEMSQGGPLGRISGYFIGVSRNDMVIFTRQLATLLEARLSLGKALKTLREQTTNPTLKETVRQMSDDVEAGLSLSQAMERQNEVFNRFTISMVRSAEVTGNLEQVSKFIADFTEREAILASKARSAMIYPSVIVFLFIVVAIIMLVVVFPQIEPIFTQSGVELPLISKVFLTAGKFMTKYWVVALVLFGIIIGIVADYIQTDEGKAMKDEFKVRAPIVRKIFLPITVTRFANAAAMLIKGGVPITQSMEIVGETVDNVVYRDILHEISNSLSQGVPLSESIARYPVYFPQLVSQMIAVGETTGQIDDILLRVGNFYGRESDAVVNNLVELIQPALMVVIGVMVGLLFAAVLLPMYSLTTAFQ